MSRSIAALDERPRTQTTRPLSPEAERIMASIWVRYGGCGACGAPIWVWLNEQGYGPHMRWECCWHQEGRMRRLASRPVDLEAA